MAAPMRSTKMILQLYKTMLRESQKFTAYNFRTYALRRIRDGFREHKSETNQEKIGSLLKYAQDNLETIKRQVTIGQMYTNKRLVIEKNTS